VARHLEIRTAHERIFFWHTSCNKSFVARKFQVKESFPAAVKTAAMNLRMATIQSGGLRVPPRIRKVPALRRRLPITMLPEHSQPVIIRHTSQNLGSLAVKPRTLQRRMV
jgi:hypothetical protein